MDACRKALLLSLWVCGAAAMRAQSSGTAPLTAMIERYSADSVSLAHAYPLGLAPAGRERFTQLNNETLAALKEVRFEGLDEEGKVDYLLLKNHAERELHTLAREQKEFDEAAPLLPFAPAIFKLAEAQRQFAADKPQEDAASLSAMAKMIADVRKAAEAGLQAQPGTGVLHADKIVGYRSAAYVVALRRALNRWFSFYNDYDPVFTWWVAEPYKEVDRALEQYGTFLKEQVAGLKPDDRATIIGTPIGRDALVAALHDAMISYTPEELVALAKNEMAWCTREMIRASREMGDGDDWHKALETVKNDYVPPGEQPELIHKLAVEGIEFAESHDLVTIPALAKETWTMDMMTPERQLVNPFFTGGDTISVSYPTDTMTYEQRMMSMRGNNIYFSRSTVFHELIPGHYLQQFMNDRYRSYRGLFWNPFWLEGNAFYWEMLYWDLGFAKTPEQRIGMLFWRMHRCARVIFTLSFHLGQMTPEQCVEFLVRDVGHEPDNARAEVRRSFQEEPNPLYQCAYMLGALQFRAMHKELVESGKMTNRAFHDAILHEGEMPVGMVRALLTHEALNPSEAPSWRFYESIAAKP
jgi:uncharacterized protein (DUF885 family)